MINDELLLYYDVRYNFSGLHLFGFYLVACFVCCLAVVCLVLILSAIFCFGVGCFVCSYGGWYEFVYYSCNAALHCSLVHWYRLYRSSMYVLCFGVVVLCCLYGWGGVCFVALDLCVLMFCCGVLWVGCVDGF